MPDIQDQFAQFVERWRGYLDCDPAPSNSEHFEEELRDFVRKIVEECCIKAGEPLLSAQRLAIRFRIADHFAWLEK